LVVLPPEPGCASPSFVVYGCVGSDFVALGAAEADASPVAASAASRSRVSESEFAGTLSSGRGAWGGCEGVWQAPETMTKIARSGTEKAMPERTGEA